MPAGSVDHRDGTKGRRGGSRRARRGPPSAQGQTPNHWIGCAPHERPSANLFLLFVCSVIPAALGVLRENPLRVLCQPPCTVPAAHADHGDETQGRSGVLAERAGGRRVHRGEPPITGLAALQSGRAIGRAGAGRRVGADLCRFRFVSVGYRCNEAVIRWQLRFIIRCSDYGVAGTNTL